MSSSAGFRAGHEQSALASGGFSCSRAPRAGGFGPSRGALQGHGLPSRSGPASLRKALRANANQPHNRALQLSARRSGLAGVGAGCRPVLCLTRGRHPVDTGSFHGRSAAERPIRYAAGGDPRSSSLQLGRFAAVSEVPCRRHRVEASRSMALAAPGRSGRVASAGPRAPCKDALAPARDVPAILGPPDPGRASQPHNRALQLTARRPAACELPCPDCRPVPCLTRGRHPVDTSPFTGGRQLNARSVMRPEETRELAWVPCIR